MVKNLPTVQETWVSSVGLKDPLEKGMATDSSSLAWKIQLTQELDGLIVYGATNSWIQLGD